MPFSCPSRSHPDAARHASVMIVNDKNQVETRAVTASQAIGDKWLITSGLKAGERLSSAVCRKYVPASP